MLCYSTIIHSPTNTPTANPRNISPTDSPSINPDAHSKAHTETHPTAHTEARAEAIYKPLRCPSQGLLSREKCLLRVPEGAVRIAMKDLKVGDYIQDGETRLLAFIRSVIVT
jgi:hypothetical protein